MGKKFYSVDEGGVTFSTDRRPGDVRIPNYVYDMWLPLLGVKVIGVYAVYCRLEREETVKGLTLDVLAKACRVGKATLIEINTILTRCGFIVVSAPKGQDRLKHFTTEIRVLDPPQEVPQEIITEYAPASGYNLLTPWLIKDQVELPEVLDRTSGSSNQNCDDVPGRTPKVESLELNPPVVEKERGQAPRASSSSSGSGDYLTDIFTGATEGLTPGIADPSQEPGRYAHYNCEFIEVYHTVTGLHPEGKQQRPALEALDLEPTPDLELWENIIRAGMINGWNPRNLSWMLDYYRKRKVPTTRNGGNGHATYWTGSKGSEVQDPAVLEQQQFVRAALERHRADAEKT